LLLRLFGKLDDKDGVLGGETNKHATQAEEEVVPASAFRASQEQIRELQRLLGKKTLENEILKEALDIATESKKRTLRSLSLPKGGSQ
jgi:transposase